MPTARNYSNTSSQATLSAAIAAADISFTLSNFTGYPSAPFTAAIARGTANEEVVLVTSVSSGTVTVTRGYDGTTAKAQGAGSTFQEVAAALDFREANAHTVATSGVHGVTGNVVGDTDVQTLTNKTLTSPTISAPTITGTATLATANVTTFTVTGVTNLAGATITGTAALTTLTVSGNATVGGTLGVTGATTLAGLTASSLSISGASTLTGLLTANGGVTTSGTVTANKLMLTSTSDASATTDGALVIGPTSGTNITIDNNELVARNNGVAASFGFGGCASVTGPTPTASSHLATKGYVDGLFGDTGWQSLTLTSPLAPTSQGAQYRVLNGIGYLALNITYSGTWTAGFLICTLPASARPSKQHDFTATLGDNTAVKCRLATNGQLTVVTAVSGGGFGLAGSFPVG